MFQRGRARRDRVATSGGPTAGLDTTRELELELASAGARG
jgi:hypothetical protein